MHCITYTVLANSKPPHSFLETGESTEEKIPTVEKLATSFTREDEE
jgi:hypothetical protein